MSEQPWEDIHTALVDTGVFIAWFHGDHAAQRFFRNPERSLYYAKVTRKELLRKPIRTTEADRIKAFLSRFRLVNPDSQIAARISELLGKIFLSAGTSRRCPYCRNCVGEKPDVGDDQFQTFCSH